MCRPIPIIIATHHHHHHRRQLHFPLTPPWQCSSGHHPRLHPPPVTERDTLRGAFVRAPKLAHKGAVQCCLHAAHGAGAGSLIAHQTWEVTASPLRPTHTAFSHAPSTPGSRRRARHTWPLGPTSRRSSFMITRSVLLAPLCPSPAETPCTSRTHKPDHKHTACAP